TPTASATASRTPPPSATPSRTPAATAVPTASPTSVPRSSTPTATVTVGTPSATPVASVTPGALPTTPAASATPRTPSPTPRTPPPTPRRTLTPTPRRTPSTTPTPLATPTGTATSTATATPPSFVPNMGGPDAYGYTYRDDRHPEGPRFAWLDPVGQAGRVSGLDHANALRAGPVALGFPSPYYGTTFDSVYVDSNGLLSSAGPAGASPPGNRPLIEPGSPPAIIAPFWDDLVAWRGDRCPTASPTSGVYGLASTQNGRPLFVVAWVDVDRYPCEGAHYSFEAVLYP